MQKQRRNAFTLVELLVVIGIIALLIAILMPALSRARKQALQASCGSNERQITYAALAYANDWKEQLPTRSGILTYGGTSMSFIGTNLLVRLPIIGWDTATIWDWGTYTLSIYSNGTNNVMLGGLGFVLRDYLKNDFDIYVCPDGWFTRSDMLKKWNGTWDPTGFYGPSNVSSQSDPQGLWTPKTGYQWLPHRGLTLNPGDSRACGGQPMADKPGEIAKTASGKPELLILADFNFYSNRNNADCPSRPTSDCGVAANHNATDNRQLPIENSNCMTPIAYPDVNRGSNPDEVPLGMNRARIDARTQWLPWQDWAHFKWCPYYAFYSF